VSPLLPGNPEVGWHWSTSGDCSEVDAIRAAFPAKNRRELVRQLRIIEARGPGRLVANKGWLRILEAE
jgi:hypothetical protein